MDYKQLNNLMPLIDELLDELHGSKYFSKIDLRATYHQIRIIEGDIPKITFRTFQGLYEFKFMPLGLINDLATFQILMNEVYKN